MVDRPIKYSLADLKRFPTVSRTYFMECSGTTGRELMRATEPTVQRSHGLVSTSEWTGVPLSTLLKQTGLKPGAAWVLAEGADAAVMTRSVPIDKCLSDALIVFAQNGEAIRPEQGYPMRLFLPGWEGNISIKWLRRLEISDQPFYTREETSKYTDLITKTGKARIFTFTMEAKSVITFPSGNMKVPGPGFYEVTGLAWSGRGKIARVEVSCDGGKTWNLAALQDPVLPICQTRFRFPWIWDGTAAVLQSRATDETGYTQPTHAQLIAERGPLEAPGMMYHMNAIQSWGIAADGSVKMCIRSVDVPDWPAPARLQPSPRWFRSALPAPRAIRASSSSVSPRPSRRSRRSRLRFPPTAAGCRPARATTRPASGCTKPTVRPATAQTCWASPTSRTCRRARNFA